jgi:recombination protein RecT
MTEQVAILPYQKLKKLVSLDETQERFRAILKDRAAGFLASLLNTVYLDENLRDADPNSVIVAALTAAALDLPIDRNLGFAWVIGYRDHGKKVARFQAGYKGYIQLAHRTRQYKDLNAGAIYRGETVKQDRLTGRIEIAGEPSSRDVIGYAAYFKLLNGFEKYYYMTKEQVIAHAERYSKSYPSSNSIWKTNFDEMATKTVLTALLKKWGLLSIDMLNVGKIDFADPEDEQTQSQALSEILSSRIDNPGAVIDGAFGDPAAAAGAAVEKMQELEPESESVPPEPEMPPPFDDPDPDPGLSEQNFVPADFLVANGICANAYQASNLLRNYIPAEIQFLPKELLAWGKIYRAWRDSGSTPVDAQAKANSGEVPA